MKNHLNKEKILKNDLNKEEIFNILTNTACNVDAFVNSLLELNLIDDDRNRLHQIGINIKDYTNDNIKYLTAQEQEQMHKILNKLSLSQDKEEQELSQILKRMIKGSDLTEEMISAMKDVLKEYKFLVDSVEYKR